MSETGARRLAASAGETPDDGRGTFEATASPEPQDAPPGTWDGRGDVGHHLGFLDGVRGLAAFYVVLHHVWLASYPGFPRDTGPMWASWMLFGHLAVAVFIVVSGFSLALSPERHHDRLKGGFPTFIRRRAFRILPPYWVALLVSVLVMVLFTGRQAGVVIGVKSVVVHGLLLQDVIGSQSPNGAFWSIALEWQIYFLFPLLLLIWRFSGWVMVGVTTAVVIAVQLAGTDIDALHKLLDLLPQFLALFAFGVAASHILVARRRLSRLPWTEFGLVLVAVTVFVLWWLPPERVAASFFWVDLLAGASVAVLFAGCAQRPTGRTARMLASRVPSWLGQSSYSLYLIQAPVLGLLYWGLIVHVTSVRNDQFLLLLVIGPVCAVAVSRVFWRLFEKPFMEHRTIHGLAAALRGSMRAPKIVRRRPTAGTDRHDLTAPATAPDSVS